MYELDDNNKYVFVRDDGMTIHIIGTEVAIAFDKETAVLFKHGVPALVNDWATRARRTLSKLDDAIGTAVGLTNEMAKDIIVIEGPIPLDELNKIITITGYIGRYYKSMQEATPKSTTINVIV